MSEQLAAERPDFRGPTPAQDLSQWVLTRAKRDEIRALRDAALLAESDGDARNGIARAHALVTAEARSAAYIAAYWTSPRPAPQWRRYWTALHPKGCATHVAVAVRSGVDELDAAALQWLETARFGAKLESGEPTAGELTANVKFVLQEGPRT